ncbi:MAG: serine/threonine protein kinase [Thermoguttaceae bacterium]
MVQENSQNKNGAPAANNYSATGIEIDLEELADAFVEEFRQGKNPDVQEYARRYPEYAEHILDLFPTLLLLEKGGASTSLSGVSSKSRSLGEAPDNLDQIKNFTIRREIARGGMGVVYEAWDNVLERVVALKVMKIFPGEREQTIKRFQREARIAAGLHHTNIVPIYGYDTVDQLSLFYYAMQLIDGMSLEQFLRLRERDATQTIDASRRRLRKSPLVNRQHTTTAPIEPSVKDAPKPEQEDPRANSVDETEFLDEVPHSGETTLFLTNPAQDKEETTEKQYKETEKKESKAKKNAFLSPSTLAITPTSELLTVNIASANYYQKVADLGLQCAMALAYAHRHNILHRDIKPSNLIVDAGGQLWITDFGLARTIDNSNNLTTAGQLVGTLRYLAPEALDGVFSQKSDVYSLGLTLYELLTFTPAYADSNYSKLVARVSEGSPERLRKINPNIPRDLENIVLKAISKDPEKRYTAQEIADELRRFLEGRPVQARRISALESMWRWAKRNKIVASLSALVTLLFLAFFLFVSVANVSMKLLVLEKEAESARAQKNLNLALTAFDRLFKKLVQNATTNESLNFDLITESASGFNPVIDLSLSESEANALDEMLKFYGEFAKVNQDSEKSQLLCLRCAQAFFRTGLIRVMQGNFGYFSMFYNAFEFYDEAIACATSEPAREEVAFEMAQLVLVMYDVTFDVQQDLEKYSSRALEVLHQLQNPTDPSRRERLVARLHLARASHLIIALRRNRELGQAFIGSAVNRIPIPPDNVRATIQREIDFARNFADSLQATTIADYELKTNYHAVVVLWLATLRQTEKVSLESEKGVQIAMRFCEVYPDSLRAYTASAKLAYTMMRVLHEEWLNAQEPSVKEDALKRYRALESIVMTETQKIREKFPNEGLVKLYHVFEATNRAKAEAAFGNLEQAEELLKVAQTEIEAFAQERPSFESAPILLRIRRYQAELATRLGKIDEAEEHLKQLDLVYDSWRKQVESRISKLESQEVDPETRIRESEFLERQRENIYKAREDLLKTKAALESSLKEKSH